MNAFGTYHGYDFSETLLRISRPMSPMSEPSRASTRDVCASWTICQASPVAPAAGVCAIAAEAAMRKNGTSLNDRKTLLRGVMEWVPWKLVPVVDDGSCARVITSDGPLARRAMTGPSH